MVSAWHRMFGYGKSKTEQSQREEDKAEEDANKETQRQYRSRLSLARQRERLKTADTIAKIEEQQYIARVKAGKPTSGVGRAIGWITSPPTEGQVRMMEGVKGGSGGGFGNMWGSGGGTINMGLNPPTSERRAAQRTSKKKGSKKHKTTRTRKPNTASPDYSNWMP